ncbi:hypothetical protein [Kibdelosporangium aridum]|uniref:hypothetical protein n=1 Tax=Kibdelosporangium aridum TaxID=2030 RepID=UPI0035E89664
MDPLVTKIAGSLAGQLAAPAGRKLRDAVLGEQDIQELDRVCRAAMRRAIAETEETGADPTHVLSLLERLMAERSAHDIPSLVSMDTPDAGTLAQWRNAAQDIGLDPSTFPISFDNLVTRLLRLIREELSRAAGKQGNALFGQVVLANLELLGANIAAVSTLGMARQIPLLARLRESLDNTYQACRATGRAFVTPDLLLVLAQTPEVSFCLDTARPGLATEMTERLRRYLSTTPTGPFTAFDWTERADVRRAQHLAWAAQIPAVTELFLLRGVLDTPTNTRDQLAAWLGTTFDQLREIAHARSHTAVTAAGTPGTIFGPTA